MFKKVLAGLTALVLSLGLVALTAAPASAHHSDVTPSFACTGPTTGVITWSVHNWNGGKTGRVWSSTGNLVPAGTDFASDETKTYQQQVTATGTYTLSVTMRWYDGSGDLADNSNWTNETTNSNSITLNSGHFSGCQPDDTDRKIRICHYDNGQGGKWTPNEVSISSILSGQGHAGHNSDVIPPFSYVKQGVAGSYPGKNWNTYGQNVWNAGCADVTPPPPTFTDAVCTGPGTWGQGSYTIPSVTGARYLVSINDGPWVEKAANTYPVPVGTKVEIKAEALSGYGLTGSDSQWEWDDTIGKPSNCDVTVTPTKPTMTQAVCSAEGQASGAGYTIPSIPGVRYEISTGNSNGPWIEILPNTYAVPDGSSVWIRAVELPGYDLAGDDGNYKWKLEFTDIDTRKCVAAADATAIYAECTAPGTSSAASYTIPSDVGIQYQIKDGANWVNIGASTVPVTTFPTTVELRAIAAPGYTLVGGPYSWTFVFESAGDCLVKVSPAAPTFTDSVCEVQTTGSTQGGYFIPTTANVTYQVTLNGVGPAPATTGVFVPTDPNDVVLITATAAAGYVLQGYTGPWPHTFADPGECLDEAPVGAVTKVNQECTIVEDVLHAGKTAVTLSTDVGVYVSGWITIPSTPHVDYFIAPDLVTALPAGNYLRDPGTYTVYAVAHPGYTLTGYSGPWVLEIVAAEPCGDLVEHPLVTPVVTFVQSTCAAFGTYTLGVEEPGLEAGVVWTVSNGLPTTLGTHAVAGAGPITITATPAPGYGFPGDDPEIEWVYDFAAPGDCLPTLALTGGGIALGGLGLSAVLLVGGMLLLGVRAGEGRPTR